MVRMAYGKDQHNLRECDISHKDKQIFDSVLHIMGSVHLLSTIAEAKGTFVYVIGIPWLQGILLIYTPKARGLRVYMSAKSQAAMIQVIYITWGALT